MYKPTICPIMSVVDFQELNSSKYWLGLNSKPNTEVKIGVDQHDLWITELHGPTANIYHWQTPNSVLLGSVQIVGKRDWIDYSDLRSVTAWAYMLSIDQLWDLGISITTQIFHANANQLKENIAKYFSLFSALCNSLELQWCMATCNFMYHDLGRKWSTLILQHDKLSTWLNTAKQQVGLNSLLQLRGLP